MRLFFILLFGLSLTLLSLTSMATHIVGGEFELIYLRDDYYTLNLKMYFDKANGDPALLTNADDQRFKAYIYSKKNNVLIKSVELRRVSTSVVSYTNPDCTIKKLSTLSLIFTADLSLPPALFYEPEGYYVVWERCCRNNTIDNIYYPGDTGQVFYLEFPAVIRAGQKFINSSPRLFPPLSDYACLNRPFYFDFAGTDPDGDSLSYSLVEPLAGLSSRGYPWPDPTSPAPYNSVDWALGISLNNVVPGSPTLKIDSTGFLRVTPAKTGLFVFAVKCEEFRNKKKIGEVRRDFQMLVIDCPQNDPPKIEVSPPANKVFAEKKEPVNIYLGEDRCFSFSVKDQDVNSQIKVNIRAVNFQYDFSEPSTYTKRLNGLEDVLTFDLCFTDCPLPNDEPKIIEIIASDNACSLPLQDTVFLYVNIEPPPNKVPEISTSLQVNRLEVKVGTPIKFNVSGVDPDGKHPVTLRAVPEDFSLEEMGIAFPEQSGVGVVQSEFFWTPSCDFLDLGKKNEYKVKFVTEELDDCKFSHRDSVTVAINFIEDPNQAPFIVMDKTISENVINALVGDQINLNITGFDPDKKFIRLTGRGINFNMEDVGINFENAQGSYFVSSPFKWDLGCDLLELADTSEFIVEFVAEDKSCFEAEADTLRLTINIKDLDVDEKRFLPPNVFTPNNDGKNEVFTLENLQVPGEFATTFSLPKDLCDDKFEEVIIVNRWGKEVFRDQKRDFAWNASGFPPGSYFYTLKYNKRIFKGGISVLY